MNRRIALAGLLSTTLTIPLTAATSGSGVVIITQADVNKGSIPGTNGASGFPITITSPGSYRLGSDLNVSGAVDGIDIDAPDVTLDLNGFTIRGPETCTGTGSGLSCPGFSGTGSGIVSSRANVSVRNGTVRGFSIDGLALFGDDGVIDSIRASDNAGTGIDVTNGLLTNSTASRNGVRAWPFGWGISGQNSQLKGNTSTGNRLYGFLLSNSGATDNVSVGNGNYGYVGSQSLISNSVSTGNALGDFWDQGGLTSAHTNSCSGVSC